MPSMDRGRNVHEYRKQGVSCTAAKNTYLLQLVLLRGFILVSLLGLSLQGLCGELEDENQFPVSSFAADMQRLL